MSTKVQCHAQNQMFKIVVFINLYRLVGKKLYRGYQTKPNPKALSTFNSSSCCVFLYLFTDTLQQGLKIIPDSLKIRKLLQLQNL